MHFTEQIIGSIFGEVFKMVEKVGITSEDLTLELVSIFKSSYRPGISVLKGVSAS